MLMPALLSRRTASAALPGILSSSIAKTSETFAEIPACSQTDCLIHTQMDAAAMKCFAEVGNHRLHQRLAIIRRNHATTHFVLVNERGTCTNLTRDQWPCEACAFQ